MTEPITAHHLLLSHNAMRVTVVSTNQKQRKQINDLLISFLHCVTDVTNISSELMMSHVMKVNSSSSG